MSCSAGRDHNDGAARGAEDQRAAREAPGVESRVARAAADAEGMTVDRVVSFLGVRLIDERRWVPACAGTANSNASAMGVVQPRPHVNTQSGSSLLVHRNRPVDKPGTCRASNVQDRPSHVVPPIGPQTRTMSYRCRAQDFPLSQGVVSAGHDRVVHRLMASLSINILEV